MNALILASDGLDFDVYKNVKYFYECCGYNVRTKFKMFNNLDVIIYLRGPIQNSFNDYSGVVHVYDYVKNLTYYWNKIFPNALKIYIISLDNNYLFESKKITKVKAFLPVISRLWVTSSFIKDSKPIHISHFKSDIKNRYQDELLKLGELNEVLIFGKRWTLSNKKVESISLSGANQLFSKSLYSFGLMYDYQIGKTLSGRMWQGPLNGCYVFTELGSNIISCPGVIEVNSYFETIEQIKLNKFGMFNYKLAVSFWDDHTLNIAQNLGLSFIDKSFLGRIYFNFRFSIILFKQMVFGIINLYK